MFHDVEASQRRNSALAFTPPKPKPLVIANCMGCGLALLATKSKPSPAGSGALRFRMGGATRAVTTLL